MKFDIPMPEEDDHDYARPERESGYNADENICWDFRNKGEGWMIFDCPCPAHDAYRAKGSKRGAQYDLSSFGRCRSGRRWFWLASSFASKEPIHGIADTEAEAYDAAMNAVRSIRKDGVPMLAGLHHGYASYALKQLNRERRAAKPPRTGTKRTPVVEYIYDWSRRYRIVKKTAKRIYYMKKGEPIDERAEPIDNVFGYLDLDYDDLGFLDRARLEKSGEDGDLYKHFFRSREALLEAHARYAPPKPPDLAALKQAMADAHPDKGGSSAAFIEARSRYVAARRSQRAHR